MTVDEKLQKELAEDADLAHRLLCIMGTKRDGLFGGQADVLQPESIQNCKAMAFMNITKGGLGLTYAHGRGFVVRKLDGGKWSAPYFFKVSQLGVGLTMGVDVIEAFVVMNDEENILKLANGDGMKIGADLWITSVGAGGVGHSLGSSGEGENKRLDKTADKLWAFQLGMMVGNIAINGTSTSSDKDKNAKLYCTTPATEVLAAPSTIPEVDSALAPVYRLLNLIEEGKFAALAEANKAKLVASTPPNA